MRIFKNSILILALLLTSEAFAQSILEDAIFLRQFIIAGEENASTEGFFSENPDDMLIYVPVLKRVLNLEANIDEDRLSQVISDKLFENPFINSEDEDETKILLPASYSSLKVATDKNPRPPISYTDYNSNSHNSTTTSRNMGSFTTRFVDGLSRWLVKRTKQELSLTFFNRFKKALNEQPDLHVMFPSTVTLLNVFEDEVYHYQAFIGTLRESFINDFNLVPQNLSDWANTTELIKDESDRFIIKEAFEIPPMIMNENSPREIIHHLGSVKNCPKAFQNVFSSFQVIDLLSESILSTEWEFPTDYEVKMDDLTLYLYLGILYEKSKNIKFSNKTFNGILEEIATETGKEKTQQFKNLVFDFLKHGKETNRFFNILSAQDSIEYTMYHQYTKSTLSLLEVGKVFHDQYVSDSSSRRFTDLLAVIGNSNDLVFHIHQKNYLQSVAHINQIVSTFMPTLEPFEIKAFSVSERKIYENRQKGKEKFIKYSTFMGTVADAQSSEQVEFAFELFALPPGSSKMKKHSPVSVALNAYVGPTAGIEYLENYDQSGVFALHAPVGINLNWGLPGENGSFSLFVPIIDVGAITAFRFGDDASTLPELNFKNIIAPGIYAVYGFGKDLPFAFGVGGQLGPNTRKIEVDEFGLPTENRIDSGFRVGAFLSVDIPVFHFYTK